MKKLKATSVYVEKKDKQMLETLAAKLGMGCDKLLRMIIHHHIKTKSHA